MREFAMGGCVCVRIQNPVLHLVGGVGCSDSLFFPSPSFSQKSHQWTCAANNAFSFSFFLVQVRHSFQRPHSK